MNFQFEIINLIVLLLTGGLLSWLCHFIKIPIVIGQIVAGILVGPSLLGWVQQTPTESIIAELDVLLLMLIAGAKTNTKLLQQHVKSSIWVAVIGALVPLLTFFVFGQFNQLGTSESIFLGLVFAATSISITTEVLNEYQELQTYRGTTILGAAIVDDILILFLLGVLLPLLMSNQIDFWGVIELTGKTILFFSVVFCWMKFGVQYLIALIRRPLFVGFDVVMLLVLMFAGVLLAHLLGLSGIIGAFFAGLSIANNEELSNAVNQLQKIGSVFFILIFFANIGLMVHLKTTNFDITFLVLLFVLALLTKWVGAGLTARFNHFSWRDANLIGQGMISRGEAAIIIAGDGLHHVIGMSRYSELVLIIILTTLTAPLLMRWTLHEE